MQKITVWNIEHLYWAPWCPQVLVPPKKCNQGGQEKCRQPAIPQASKTGEEPGALQGLEMEYFIKISQAVRWRSSKSIVINTIHFIFIVFFLFSYVRGHWGARIQGRCRMGIKAKEAGCHPSWASRETPLHLPRPSCLFLYWTDSLITWINTIHYPLSITFQNLYI